MHADNNGPFVPLVHDDGAGPVVAQDAYLVNGFIQRVAVIGLAWRRVGVTENCGAR